MTPASLRLCEEISATITNGADLMLALWIPVCLEPGSTAWGEVYTRFVMRMLSKQRSPDQR